MQWTGEISSITQSGGQYRVTIIHCPQEEYDLFKSSDVSVLMNADQKELLLNYKEGDQITYKAKLISYSDWSGISGANGIEVQ